MQVRAVLMAGLAVAAVMASTGPAAADVPDYPYSYLHGLTLADVPAETDCTPAPGKADPVVLLPGFIANSATTWQALAPQLRDEGYCVYLFDYGHTSWSGDFGGIASVVPAAREFARYVDDLLAETGSRKIDLIGHSEGGTMPFYHLTRLDGTSKVDSYIGIAPLYRGTTQWGLAPLINLAYASPVAPALGDFCGACGDMIAGSRFLTDLAAHGDSAPGVRFTNIMTRYDENATPYTTGMLDGANVTNVVVQDRCATDYSDHYQLPYSPTTASIVLDALDPGRNQPTACALSLPILGVPGR
ncbi:esterase/lipase family protein [Aldersonia kunmingensis]|uniref:esterase/lipase family protein n=1 Tax=Aldersonia kunmingensis TaxID=408066 RepID=UPI000A071A6D|nr:alpha/beta fold hydrolase [Aldersonia kunmingensis]